MLKLRGTGLLTRSVQGRMKMVCSLRAPKLNRSIYLGAHSCDCDTVRSGFRPVAGVEQSCPAVPKFSRNTRGFCRQYSKRAVLRRELLRSPKKSMLIPNLLIYPIYLYPTYSVGSQHSSKQHQPTHQRALKGSTAFGSQTSKSRRLCWLKHLRYRQS
jgi:hypothetical protein